MASSLLSLFWWVEREAAAQRLSQPVGMVVKVVLVVAVAALERTL